MNQGPPGGYNPPPGGYGGPPPGGPPGGYGGPPAGGYGGAGSYGGPPAPYGGFPPPGPLAPGGGVANIAAFTHREPLTLLALTLVTCGIYALIWKYQTTEELRQASGDNSINPGLDIALTVLLCGIWGIYTDYRNAKKIYELAQASGVQRSDQSTIAVVLDCCGFAFITPFLLQSEFNALAQAAQSRQLPR